MTERCEYLPATLDASLFLGVLVLLTTVAALTLFGVSVALDALWRRTRARP